MKKSIALIFVASTFLLAGCCTTPHATKWEYKVETSSLWAQNSASRTGVQDWGEQMQRHLNDLGKDGWVLISERDGLVFYFKRPSK